MLKSVLSVFTGAFGMILKVILIIALCFIAGYCLFSMITMAFIWGGLIRLACIAACVLAIHFLRRPGREDDSPAEDDFRP